MADAPQHPEDGNTGESQPARTPGAPEPPAAPAQPQQPVQPRSASPEPASPEASHGLAPVEQPQEQDDSDGPGNAPQNASPSPSKLALFGWFCMGFFFALPGVLITMFLVWRRDRAARNRALAFSCIGLLAELALYWILLSVTGIDPNSATSTSLGDSSTSSVW